MGTAVARSDRLRQASEGIDLTVRQVVNGGPEGDVTYALRLADGTVTVIAGDGHPDADADLEVVQDYATAADISRGDLTPSAAFAAGRLKLGGNVGVLVRHGDVAAGLDDLFGSLRAETTY